MKLNARYSIASITSKDAILIERKQNLKFYGYTDEDIFIAGLEALEKQKNIS